MQAVIAKFEQKFRKAQVPTVQPGDTVRVHQKIREGNKERVQIFEGTVIRTHRPNSLTANLTVRRIASGVGVEKSFMLHSPNVVKVQIMRRSKVRRNYLSYLRARTGKAARLSEVDFDKTAANAANEVPAEAEQQESAEATVEDKVADAAAEASTEEAAADAKEDSAKDEASRENSETDKAEPGDTPEAKPESKETA